VLVKKKIIATHLKGFLSKEEWCFPFWNISFRFRDIYVFCVTHANEESDDIIGGSTKTVQHLIENIFRNIRAGNRDVHHTRNKLTNSVLLPGQHFWPQSISLKNSVPICNPYLFRTHMVPLMPWLFPLDCWEWVILV